LKFNIQRLEGFVGTGVGVKAGVPESSRLNWEPVPPSLGSRKGRKLMALF
jgi:hypothetical protein